MSQTATKERTIDAQVLHETPAAMPLVPVQSTATPSAFVPRHCPNLATALATAQQKCKRVQQDAYNSFHRYKYASSEAVIEAAQEALHGTGLSLLPLEQSLNGWERSGENRFELSRKFVLLHSSGESMPLTVAWPVVPEKGRPLDKATAIAATLSLAYLLRDLLLMPRVEHDDDVNSRDDTKPQQQQHQQASPPKQKPTSAPAQQQPVSPPAPAAQQPAAPSNGNTAASKEPPKTVAELAKRIEAAEKRYVPDLFAAGELAKLAKSFADEENYPEDRKAWTEAQVRAVHAELNKSVQERQSKRMSETAK